MRDYLNVLHASVQSGVHLNASVTNLSFCRMFSPCLDRTPSAEGDNHQHREHIKDAVMDVTRTKLQGQKKSSVVILKSHFQG